MARDVVDASLRVVTVSLGDGREADVGVDESTFARWNNVVAAEVPQVVASVYTPAEWREMLVTEWLVWNVPQLVTDSRMVRYRELWARFKQVLTWDLVAELERKVGSDEDMSWAEEQLWRAAVEVSKAKLPPLVSVSWNEGEPEPPEHESHRAWDEWNATPIAASFVGAPPMVLVHAPPRYEARAPRARRRVARRVARRRARSPSRSDEPEPPPLDRGPERLGPYIEAELIRLVPLDVFNAAVARWLEGVA